MKRNGKISGKIAEQAFAERLNRIINQKLEIACKICGITEEDTISGKKHINKVEEIGRITYIYAEKKVCLLVVDFYDDRVKIRRIRKSEYWFHGIKGFFKLV